jgi:hypothetical protein
MPSKDISRSRNRLSGDDIFRFGILDDARWDVHLWRFNDDALAFVRDVRKLHLFLSLVSRSTKVGIVVHATGIFTGGILERRMVKVEGAMMR